MQKSKLFLLFLFCFLAKNLVFATMPPKPGVFDDKTEFENKTVLSAPASLLQNQFVSAKSISYYSPYSFPKINPLVVLVDFKNKKFANSRNIDFYKNLIFADIGKSMKTFYLENSGGKLEIIDNGIYPTILENPFDMEKYGADSSPKAGSDNKPQDLALWIAIELDTLNFDFSKYDANNDKIVDALIVIHAGSGQESSGKSDDIWTHKGVISGGSYLTKDNYKIIDYMLLSETSSLGAFSHEFGHILGLPDLYNTATGASTMKNWCLMDSGGWADNGNTPTHLSAWCKNFLGWGNLKTLTSNEKNISINATENLAQNPNAIEFYKMNVFGDPNEYFLIEYRNKKGFDASLPDKGILIWHVDNKIISKNLDSNAINVGIPNRGVKLVEADGMDAGLYGSRDTNLFRENNIFNYPYNRSFSGLDSNIVIDNFQRQEDFSLFSFYSYKTSEISQIFDFFVFPNPIYLSKNSKAKIRILCSDFLFNSTIKIFDITGKNLYETKINSNSINQNLSIDKKICYDVEWDVISKNNQRLASGIYIIFLETKFAKKFTKLAVIR